MLLYKWSDFLTRRQTHTKRKMHCQHTDIIRITFVAFYLYLNLNSIFSYLWKFQNKSCRVWCKFQNFLGLQFKFQWKLETKENTKFYFYFSYLWAEREYTIHSRYNGSSSKWKPEMKADAVWPTNKENTVSLLRGLHVRKCAPKSCWWSPLWRIPTSLEVSTWTPSLQRKERQYTQDMAQESKRPRKRVVGR